MNVQDIKKVVVVGATGTMGAGIVQTFAAAGIPVRAAGRSQAKLASTVKKIANNLRVFIELGVIKEPAAAVMSRIETFVFSDDVGEAARDCQFVVETVPEVLETKREILSRLSERCSPETVVASNTSGLDIFSIDEMAQFGRLVIAHWYVPAHIIPLVEVVPGPQTSRESVQLTSDLMARIGKEPLIMKKFVPGFISNQLQNAYNLVMLRMLTEELASPEEIDKAMKYSLGLRIPVMGIVQSLDFNGLDTVQSILKRLQVNVPLIDQKVAQGHLGAKASKGLYDYQGRSEEEILEKRDRRLLIILEQLKKMNAFEPI